MNKKLIGILLVILVILIAVQIIGSSSQPETLSNDGTVGMKIKSPAGIWTSADDARYVIDIKDNGTYAETYDGDMVTASGNWTANEAGGKAVITLTIDGMGADQNRDWQIVTLTDRELEVIHTTGRGNILRFTR